MDEICSSWSHWEWQWQLTAWSPPTFGAVDILERPLNSSRCIEVDSRPNLTKENSLPLIILVGSKYKLQSARYDGWRRIRSGNILHQNLPFPGSTVGLSTANNTNARTCRRSLCCILASTQHVTSSFLQNYIHSIVLSLSFNTYLTRDLLSQIIPVKRYFESQKGLNRYHLASDWSSEASESRHSSIIFFLRSLFFSPKSLNLSLTYNFHLLTPLSLFPPAICWQCPMSPATPLSIFGWIR